MIQHTLSALDTSLTFITGSTHQLAVNQLKSVCIKLTHTF